LSAVGVVAVFLSESFGTVINDGVGNGVGVPSLSCATGLVLGGSSADGANACAPAIWIPHIATAIQVDMCSSFIINSPRPKVGILNHVI
jgi:hypothetical protein